MARGTDREWRRRDIADALLRVAGERGLHAATMRAVAAEAGVSLHLVQHYFDTKEQLMSFALQRLAELMRDRVVQRVSGVAGPRELVETILAEALPTDPASRLHHLVYTSYAMLAVTDPALAAHPFLAAPDAMESFVAEQLAHGRPGTDPRLESAALLAMCAGLGAGVLAGQRSAEDAMAVLRHQLDRLFEVTH
ncbi:TetR/AcrR family transcriptional regulator [Nonomuraea sp. LPB2021202275-12-8]|uniref:TetR/AcrR family transcriptional regulator n=1 Tax=Nonomuraea sp. LPB2021202275-12-8 TaxID=3120159 RepID=UPI00300D19F3